MAGGLAGGYDHDLGTVGRQCQIDIRIPRNRGLLVNISSEIPCARPFYNIFQQAGVSNRQRWFSPCAVLEWNPNACATLRQNQEVGLKQLRDARIVNGNIRKFVFREFAGEVDLVSDGVEK